MSWTTHRAKIAALSRSRPADDPELLAAHRDLRFERAVMYLNEHIADRPPLTDEQTESLVAIIRAH